MVPLPGALSTWMEPPLLFWTPVIGPGGMAMYTGDKFPAWQKDPLGETLRAIEGIPNDKVFVDGYADFQRDMVYGDNVPDFDTAVATLKELAQRLNKELD